MLAQPTGSMQFGTALIVSQEAGWAKLHFFHCLLPDGGWHVSLHRRRVVPIEQGMCTFMVEMHLRG